MKKKGFTLIELLAVIVILAVIAVIITPVISEVIESARKAAAKTSAQGYIDAVKNRISLAILDKNPLSGTNTVSDLESEVEYKGTRIEKGVVTISDDTLTEAKLCVNGYSFVYRNDKIDNSDINYCVDKSNIEISILGNTTTQELNNQYSYDLDLSSYDITTATNMVCNNNAVPSINENTLHIENIYGDTKCSIESSIATTFDNLDNTTNNIVMIADDAVTTRLDIFAGKNVVFDLNGHILSLDSIQIRGTLTAIDSKNSGKFISIPDTANTFNLVNSAKLTLRNIVMESANSGIWVSSACTDCIADIYDVNLTSTKRGIGIHGSATGSVINLYGNTYINAASSPVVNSGSNNTINIYGGTYISSGEVVVRSDASSENGRINITQTDAPIYISSTALAWKPAIYNNSAGIINITANQANACTNNSSDTTSGLCVYVGGNGLAQYTDGGGSTIQNRADGIINVNGGTYYANVEGISGSGVGTINIKNASISSGLEGIVVNANGYVNLCDIVLNSTSHDLYIKSGYTGTINYNNVTFTNGTNTPDSSKVSNPSGTINAVSTCSITQ